MARTVSYCVIAHMLLAALTDGIRIETFENQASQQRLAILSQISELQENARKCTVLEETLSDEVTALNENVREILNVLKPGNDDVQVHENINCDTKSFLHGYNGNQYMLGLASVNWYQARQLCYDCGFSLARIESAAEHSDVTSWLDRIGARDMDEVTKTWDGEGGFHPNLWHDGTDEGHEGHWVWTYPSITPFGSGYTNWGPNEPNNHPTRGGQNCNNMWRNWLWDDNECDFNTSFVCKRPLLARIRLPTMEEVRIAE